ncbi:hypothetical protein V8E51_018356 [Hyaloscypha variabilis]
MGLGPDGRAIGDETKRPDELGGDTTGAHPTGFDAVTGERKNTPATRPANPGEDQKPVGEFEYKIEGSDACIHGNSTATDGWKNFAFGEDYFGPHGPVLGITGEGLVSFLSETSTRARNDFMIIDLRNEAEDFKSDPEPKQIKMAVHFPLYMDRPTSSTSEMSPDKDWNYKDLATRDDRPLELWEELIRDNTGSIADWGNMKYIFFHCVAGQNRTPAAAVGFFKYVASRDHTRDPPQIVVIEGGFDGFKNSPGSEQFIGPWRV